MSPLQQKLDDAMATRDRAVDECSALRVAQETAEDRIRELEAEECELRENHPKALAAAAIGKGAASDAEALRARLVAVETAIEEQRSLARELGRQVGHAEMALIPLHREVANALLDLVAPHVAGLEKEAVELATRLSALLGERVRWASLVRRAYLRAQWDREPIRFSGAHERLLAGRVSEANSDMTIRDLVEAHVRSDVGALQLADALALDLVAGGPPEPKRSRKRSTGAEPAA